MNKIYKLIWSKVKNMWVAVAEIAKSHTKAPNSGVVGRIQLENNIAMQLRKGTSEAYYPLPQFVSGAFFSTEVPAQVTDGKSFKITVAAIVKNEAENVPTWVQAARSCADEIVVVDTGSTDDTVKRFADYGIKCFHYDWNDDFASAKNYMISLCHGDWIVLLDGDEWFREGCDVRKAIAKHHNNPVTKAIIADWICLDKDRGNVVMFSGGAVRAFRNQPDVRYFRKVHENLTINYENFAFEPEFKMYHTGYSGSVNRSKHERNLRIMRTMFDFDNGKVEYPTDWRYIEDTYAGLGDFPKALWAADKMISYGVQDYSASAWVTKFNVLFAMKISMEEMMKQFAYCFRTVPSVSGFRFLASIYYFRNGQIEAGLDNYIEGLRMLMGPQDKVAMEHTYWRMYMPEASALASTVYLQNKQFEASLYACKVCEQYCGQTDWTNGALADVRRVLNQTEESLLGNIVERVLPVLQFGKKAVLATALASSLTIGMVGVANPVFAACCNLNGNSYNETTGADSTVTGGQHNTASGQCSSVSGGSHNTASAIDSSVSGGSCSVASGYSSSVSGGQCNIASGCYSSVSGGYCNIAGLYYSYVNASGQTVYVSPSCSAINAAGTKITVGGCEYDLTKYTGENSSVSGGSRNIASGCNSSVSGGSCSVASGYSSSVSGGCSNIASGYWSSVSGGCCNTASNSWSSVSGGVCNEASCSHSFVGGGKCNTANGEASSVFGGVCNTASGYWSSVSGGCNGLAYANYSTVIGGGIAGNASCAITALGSVAIGSGATTTKNYEVAIGSSSAPVKIDGALTVDGAKTVTDGTNSKTWAELLVGGTCNDIVLTKFTNTAASGYSDKGYGKVIVGGTSSNSAGAYWNATAINGEANGLRATAIGYGAQAGLANQGTSQDAATAIGAGSKALGNLSLAIGDSAETAEKQGWAVAIGAKSYGGFFGSAAVGYGAKAYGKNSVALGRESYTGKNDANVLRTGAGSTAKTVNGQSEGRNAVAIGYLAAASEDNAMALGYKTEATGINAIAMGSGIAGNDGDFTNSLTRASGQNSMAFGFNARAANQNSVAFGAFTEAYGERAVVFGTSGTDVVNDGNLDNARASGQGSIALGDRAVVDSNILSTSSTDTGSNDSIAIGTQARVRAKNAVALGGNASYTEDGTTVYASHNGRDGGALVGDYADGGIAIGGAVVESASASGITVSHEAAAVMGKRGIAIGSGALVASKADYDTWEAVVNSAEYITAKNEYEAAETAYLNKQTEVGQLQVIYDETDAADTEAKEIALRNLEAAQAELPELASTLATKQNYWNTQQNRALALQQGEASGLADAIAIGSNANAGIHNSVAIGSNAKTGDLASDSIALGNTAVTGTNAENSIAIGGKALTGENADSSIAIGYDSQVTGEESIAIGLGHRVTGNHSGTFGDPNIINADNSYAVGNNVTIANNTKNVFVLGNNVTVNNGTAVTDTTVAEGVIALGNNASVSLDNKVTASRSSDSSGSPTVAHSVAIGDNAVVGEENAMALGYQAQAKALNSQSFGSNAQALSEGAAAIGHNAKVNGNSSFATVVGYDAEATGEAANAFGYDATAGAKFATAFGRSANATAEASTAIGNFSSSGGKRAVAIGNCASVSTDSDDAVAIGSNAKSLTNYNVAIGFGSLAKGWGDGSVAIGKNANVGSETDEYGSSTAVGGGADVQATYGTAVGSKASVTENNSVALGAGSVASESNVVSVGTGTDGGNNPATRRIVNVTDGTSATDAATVGQVRTVSEGNGIVLTETTNTNGSKNEAIAVKAGTNVTVDTNGVNVVGNGAVASANTGLISGGTAYSELRPTANGNYIATANTTAQNLSALDSALKTADNTAIKNITASGTTVTFTKGDGTTDTFTTQDNNTEYTAGNGLTLTGTEFSAKAGTNVTVDANGISVAGNGTVVDGNTGLVSGGMLFAEGRVSADGTYVGASNTIAGNLSALDTAVKTNADAITQINTGLEGKANTSLDNITNDGKFVIKTNAKEAINVVGSGKATVDKTDVNGVDTYTVGVTVDGTVAEGNTGIVDGGTVYSALQAQKTTTDTVLTGKANVALDNVTEAGHNVIKSDAKAAVNAVAGTHTTISKMDVDGVDTYAVNVTTDGAVVDGNTGIVTGGTVYTAVNDEKTARETADTTLQGNIDTEVTARQSADTALQESITAEQTARTTADTALSDRIGTLSADGTYIRQTNNVSQNLSALDSAVNTLSDGKVNVALDNINNDGKTVVRNLAQEAVKVVAGTYTTVTEGTDGEAKTYAINVTADGVVAENDTGLVTGGAVYTVLNTEKVARETADTTLQGNIDAEATTRGNEDTRLAGLITAEETARQGADTTLQTNITAEETARIAGDTALSDRIGTVSADGNYIRQVNDVSQNLVALDGQVKTNADAIVANKTKYFGVNAQFDEWMDENAEALKTKYNVETKEEYDALVINGLNIHGDGALGKNSVAIGTGAIAGSDIPNSLGATEDNAVAIGNNVKANAYQDIAIGDNASTVGSGNKAIAIGAEAKAKSSYNIAMGYDTEADGVGAFAIGKSAKALNADTIAIGYQAQVTGGESVSIGIDSTVSGGSSVAIGQDTKVDGNDSVAIGYKAYAKAGDSVALGESTKALAGNSVAIGNSANVAENANGGTAVGFLAKANGSQSTSLGEGSTANGDYSVSLGNQAMTGGLKAVALGNVARGVSDSAVAIGDNSLASGERSIAIGGTYNNNAEANGPDAIAIGSGSKARTLKALAIGVGNNITGVNSIAVGSGLTVNGANSGAFGDPSVINATNSYSVGNNNTLNGGLSDVFVLGNNVTATNTDTVILGSGSEAKEDHVVSVGRAEVKDGDTVTQTAINRRIVNVGAGVNDTDAVNVSQLNELKNTLDTSIANSTAYFSVNSTETPNRDGKGATGVDAMAIGDGASASGNSSAALGDYADAKGLRSIALGNSAGAEKDYGIAIGGLAKAKADGGIALGTSANVTGANGMAFGNSAKAEGATSYAIGQGADAKGESSIAFGTSSESATTGVAMGHMAKATGESGVALGTATNAGKTAVAIGHGANAGAEAAMALGVNSSATQPTAVAIGMGSTATEANTVSFGNASTKRRVVNIADGVADNDAVAMSQLNTLEETMNDGLDTKANLTLNNIDNAGKTVIRDLAKESVKVVNGTHTTVTEGTEGNAKTYAVNVTTDGEVSQNNTGIVTGGTVYDAVHAEEESRKAADTALSDRIGTINADKNYVLKDNSVSDNLVALDAQVKTNTDDITGLKDLSNLTDAGETVIKNLSKGSVNVIGTGKASVVKTNVEGVDTYTVTVNDDGLVADGNTNLVSGDAVYDAVHAEQIVRENADTALSDRIGTLSADGNYIGKDNAVSSNLSALDTQLKSNTDTIATHTMDIAGLKDLSNITDAGKNVIKSYAKGSVNVTGSGKANVTKTDVFGVDTYNVEVLANGAVADGNTDIVSGGAVHTAIENAKTELSEAISNSSAKYFGVKSAGGYESNEHGEGAIGDGSVAIGTSPMAMGNNSIAVGAMSATMGDGSVAVGNSATALTDGAVAIGKNAQSPNEKTVAIGDTAVASGENSVALGANADTNNKANSVALGSGSVATDENAVSVGNTETKRRVVNVAKGTVASDAAVVEQTLEVVDGLNSKVVADGTNTIGQKKVKINVEGLGTVAENNTALINGGTMYTELRPADGTYVKNTNTTASNLSALDTQVKTNTDDITNLKDLSNITDAGKTVIKDFAKGAVSVTGSGKATVTKSEVNGVDTYNVNVTANGTVTEGNMDIVTGGAVHSAIQNAIASSEGGTSTALAGKANVALDNLTEAGHNVIKADAKSAVNVVGGNYATVTKTDENGVDTYTVNVATDGEIANGNDKLVTGGTVYTAINNEKTARENADTALSDRIGTLTDDGNYVSKDASVADNLVTLDTQLKSNTDTINTHTTDINGLKDLSNITTAGENVIRELSKGSVNVIGDGLATVSKSSTGNVDTYTVRVAANGAVAEDNEGIVTGGDVYDAIDVAVNEVSNVVGIKANADASNIGRYNAGGDNASQWGAALGTDAIEMGNFRLVTSQGMFEELRPTNGSYITGDKSVAENLSQLDTQVKTNADTISDLAGTVVRYDSADKESVTLGTPATAKVKVTNVAEGTLSTTSTDAVNGSQLYQTNQAVNKEKEERENADTEISNRIGTMSSDGEYVKKDDSVSTNLSTLDRNLKSVSDSISSFGDLGSLTDTGRDVIRTLSKESVKVIDGTNTTVTKGTDGNADTYAVNVTVDGSVTQGNEGLVKGGDIYEAIQSAIASGTPDALTSKANTDLSNLNDDGKKEVRNLAKDAVNVKGENGINVTQVTSEGPDGVTKEFTATLLKATGVEQGNTNVVDSGTMFSELRPADGDYVAQSNTTAQNLSTLDTALKSVNDTVEANYSSLTGAMGNKMNVSLSNITDSGKETLRKIARSSVKVESSDGSVDVEASNVDVYDAYGSHALYDISVKKDGAVVNGNTGIVTGGTVAAETRVASDGEYVRTANSAGENIRLLDTALKSVADLAQQSAEAGRDANAVHYDSVAKDTVSLAGADGTVITNLKDGAVSADSKDAVTGKQLYGVKETAEQVARDVQSLHDTVGALQDGSYISSSETVGNNLKSLDTQVKSNTDALNSLQQGQDGINSSINELRDDMGGKADTDLGNLSNAGKDVIRNLAGDAVDVVSSDNTLSVSSSIAEGVKTFDLSVKKDGEVVAGNTGIVTGGTVYEAIQNVTVSDERIREVLGDSLDAKADAGLGNLTEEGKDVIRETVRPELDKKANVDASNIDVQKWTDTLGTGKVEEGNGNLVRGGEVYDAIRKIDVNNGMIQSSDGVVRIGANDASEIVDFTNSEGSGRVLRGVVTDISDKTSAANVGYVDAMNRNVLANVNDGLSRMDKKINKVGAGAAAMASLAPMPFDSDQKWSISAAVGTYKGETSGAIGAFYRPLDNVMLNIRGAVGNGENMAGAGVTIGLNKGGATGLSKAQMVRAMNAQANEIVAQKEMIQSQQEQLELQKQQIEELKAMFEDMKKAK